MNAKKEAAHDATRWLAAEMAYGKGAGTRRKLLDAEITQKMIDLGDKYANSFNEAYANLDMDKYAKAAIKERKHLDRANFLGKNARALVRGDIRNVSPMVYAAIIGGYYAHQTGYDKKVLAEAKVQYTRAKLRVNAWLNPQDSVIDINKPYGGVGE